MFCMLLSFLCLFVSPTHAQCYEFVRRMTDDLEKGKERLVVVDCYTHTLVQWVVDLHVIY